MVADPRPLILAAPAKVNLFLHVVGRRGDGYHLIESLFALIDLADTVMLTFDDNGSVARTNDVDGVPAEEDLAIRAAHSLRQATGTRHGVAIRVDKRIPIGAGWAAAAPTRQACCSGSIGSGNSIFRGPRSRRSACRSGPTSRSSCMGRTRSCAASASTSTPVSLPRQWLALAMPATHVPTPCIFASPELTRCTASAKISVFSESYGRNDLAAGRGVAVSRCGARARFAAKRSRARG